jgi:hypothetical protein
MSQETELGFEEREYILLSKIKFVNSEIYNNEIDLQLENAKENISEENVQIINERLRNCNSQKTLLNTLLEQLTA